MSWFSKFLKIKASIPAENLHLLSTSDLEKLRDLTLVAIANRKVQK
jgi:hypothetical protein